MPDNVQEVAVKVNELFEALATLTPGDLSALSNKAVGLRDTNKFRSMVSVVSQEETSKLRRQLAEAVAAEKWMDGFVFALQLLSTLGSI